MGQNLLFRRGNLLLRGWYYFRSGWTTYFTFLLGAVNTLTVTYYLAIDNYGFLNDLFPTFAHYVVVAAAVGIPLLLTIGYVHYKRSSVFKSEVNIGLEVNPLNARMFTNSDINLILSLKTLETLTSLSRNEKLSSRDYEKITEISDVVRNHIESRVLDQKTDLMFYRTFQKFRKGSA